MEMNKLVFGGLALGCLAAAAGGGFLAARQSAVPKEAAISAPAPTASETVAPNTPVSESEGIIAPDAGKAAPPAPAVAPAAPSPAPRRESPRPESSVPARQPAVRSTPAGSTARAA